MRNFDYIITGRHKWLPHRYWFRKPRTHNLRKANCAHKTDYREYMSVKDMRTNVLPDSYDDKNSYRFYHKSWKDKHKIRKQWMKNI